MMPPPIQPLKVERDDWDADLFDGRLFDPQTHQSLGDGGYIRKPLPAHE